MNETHDHRPDGDGHSPTAETVLDLIVELRSRSELLRESFDRECKRARESRVERAEETRKFRELAHELDRCIGSVTRTATKRAMMELGLSLLVLGTICASCAALIAQAWSVT
jgi:ABC-type tungstate transport system substrate-binding protein